MEISAKKTKLMANSTSGSGINTEIKVNGQKLEYVAQRNWLVNGALLSATGWLMVRCSVQLVG